MTAETLAESGRRDVVIQKGQVIGVWVYEEPNGVEDAVSEWPSMSVHPHRLAARRETALGPVLPIAAEKIRALRRERDFVFTSCIECDAAVVGLAAVLAHAWRREQPAFIKG